MGRRRKRTVAMLVDGKLDLNGSVIIGREERLDEKKTDKFCITVL